MPIMQLYITLPARRVPQDFPQKITVVLSQVIANTPPNAMNIHVMTDQNFYTGNDPERTKHSGYAMLYAMATGSPDDNRRIITALYALVKQELGIDQKHFFVLINDVDPNMCGYKGKLLADMLKSIVVD
ncbi:unnamed protein product [Medioppia subpectinata]|uniref:Macrophage migration inhibitory factor n=1 Tax=Medioppia subpectinata TaxID=1979941 RepID=A0A7R9L656_9ACAR|nr:unnamed protein product [Medioppia subpectinata]CAG2115211.1 unnamed protein product [Medioppia subpectinata]